MKNEDSWQPSRFIKRNGKMVVNKQEVSPGSHLICDLVLEAYTKAMKEHLQGKLLDCGCGKAPYYEIYRPLVDDVTCIDWGSSLHETSYLDDSADLNQGLPYGTETFDSILLTDVLEHLNEPRKFLASAYDALKENGRMIVGVPFLYNIHESPHDYFRYTEFGLRFMAEKAGFEVVEITPYGGYLEVLFNQIAKFKPHSGILNSLNLLLYRFVSSIPYFRRLRKRTRHVHPLGYVVILRKPGR